MVRRNFRKLIPTYAILPLILTGLGMLLSYQATKLLQLLFDFGAGLDMTTPWDTALPFAPVWVLAYIGSYFFWIYQYVSVARKSAAIACRLAVADLTGKLICLIFFIAMPTTNVRPAVTQDGVVGFLMRFIYWADTPTNLFPSIHCFVAWLGTRFVIAQRPRRPLVFALCVLGSLLVFASTLFTKQHVLADVISGVAVAEIGWLVARFTPLPQRLERLNDRFMRTRLCAIL